MRYEVLLLLLCGCSSLTVRPPVEVEHTVVWSGEWFSNRLNLPWWSPDQVPFHALELGIRDDGVLVARPNTMATNEAEAMRLWREYEAKAFEQAEIDRGVKTQKLYE